MRDIRYNSEFEKFAFISTSQQEEVKDFNLFMAVGSLYDEPYMRTALKRFENNIEVLQQVSSKEKKNEKRIRGI